MIQKLVFCDVNTRDYFFFRGTIACVDVFFVLYCRLSLCYRKMFYSFRSVCLNITKRIRCQHLPLDYVGIPENERFEEPSSLSAFCEHTPISGGRKIKFGLNEKLDPHFSSNYCFTN